MLMDAVQEPQSSTTKSTYISDQGWRADPTSQFGALEKTPQKEVQGITGEEILVATFWLGLILWCAASTSWRALELISH